MSESTAPAPYNASGLTQEEAQFVYNVEVLGLPVRKAATMAGLPVNMVSKPHLLQARALLKREMRGHMAITKEDIIHGIQEAIYRAQIINEPGTEIMGWDRIAKLLGHDAPQQVNINIQASVEVLKNRVGTMGDAELVEILGANGIIDADFVEVRNG